MNCVALLCSFPTFAALTPFHAVCRYRLQTRACAMAAVRLTYFNFGGRGFAIRVALGAALKDGKVTSFEDARLSFPEWREQKGDTGKFPLGQLPVLEVDGKRFCQSTAILRWSGRVSGLYPEDALEALLVDEVISSADEGWSKLPHGAEDLASRRAAWLESMRSKYAPYLESKLSTSGGPFVLGARLSIADLFVCGVMDTVKAGFLDHIPTDAFDAGFPSLVGHYQAVKAHPLVVAHGK